MYHHRTRRWILLLILTSHLVWTNKSILIKMLSGLDLNLSWKDRKVVTRSCVINLGASPAIELWTITVDMLSWFFFVIGWRVMIDLYTSKKTSNRYHKNGHSQDILFITFTNLHWASVSTMTHWLPQVIKLSFLLPRKQPNILTSLVYNPSYDTRVRIMEQPSSTV